MKRQGSVFAAVVVAVTLATGAGAQGIWINEVLANPDEALGTEWVELYNGSAQEVNLAGWKIGDALREEIITSQSLRILPGGFVVLAQDSAAFRAYFAGGEITVIEPGSWPVLNNTGDTVRLIDSAGMTREVFAYVEVFPGNITWSRDPEDTSRWGESRTAGGSPGEVNELSAGESDGGLRVRVSPRVFSPDGDGIEETVSIVIEGSASEGYAIEIYDREGREVWREDIGTGTLQEAYEWAGVRTGGGRLRPGIYIVYVEGADGEAARETVVIAR